MLPHAQELIDLGLSFVISAGWMPGISELVVVFANAVARSRMNTTESLTVYFGDNGKWSDNACATRPGMSTRQGFTVPRFSAKASGPAQ
jgi:hypothetical protein